MMRFGIISLSLVILTSYTVCVQVKLTCTISVSLKDLMGLTVILYSEKKHTQFILQLSRQEYQYFDMHALPVQLKQSNKE